MVLAPIHVWVMNDRYQGVSMPTAQANVAAAALGSGSSTPNAERQAGDMMRRALGSRHCNFVPVRRG
jgi:hypothetical protein